MVGDCSVQIFLQWGLLGLGGQEGLGICLLELFGWEGVYVLCVCVWYLFVLCGEECFILDGSFCLQGDWLFDLGR